MGKKKYNGFYFIEDGKTHPDSDYWDLYNKNKNEAIKKFEGKMNCDLCFMAPLTVAKGRKLKYFKVNLVDVNKHSENCPYLLNEAIKNEVKEFYESATDEDIKNRLTICMNKMLKQKIKEKSRNRKSTVKEDNNEFEAFIIENREGKKKYLPTSSLYSQHIREELGKSKIYYGKCKVYYKAYIDENNENKEIKRYYLQILNNKTDKLICSLLISPTVFSYLKYANLPNENENYKEYYLCFFAEFYIKEGYLNTTLKDSRMILFEEVGNNQ